MLSPSWGAHLSIVSGTLDGFLGDNPTAVKGVTPGYGWGCDSDKMAAMRSGGPRQPGCVPDYSLGLPNGGAFALTTVPHVPTIMDALDAAGLPWRIYGTNVPGHKNGYQWSVCPSFAGCLYTGQRSNLVDAGQFAAD